MVDLPDGTVTFLFTDVEGSTSLWEEAPDSMMDALRLHDSAIDSATADHGGIPVKPRGEGDSRFIVFASAIGAVAAASEIQRRLAEVAWPTPRPIRIRISLHTGTAELQLGDYYGSAVNRSARLRAIAHGGQTVMSRSTWELVQDNLPDGVTVQDMGDHRLRDLTRPERVYQINADGLDGDFPPLASLDAVPTNLPIQLTDFVGRQRELDEVERLVGASRLVTILAPGGAGKTRLAIQTAANLSSNYRDGVFLVDLAPVTLARDIPQTVAESVGLALGGEGDITTELLRHLANDQALLVFDNVEHLPEAADLVSDLLRTASEVTVIATSRTKLAVTGETVFNLPGLEIEWDSPEEALTASGVLLFIEAAMRTDSTFSLSIEDLDSVREILRSVSGMPLGILLAAAWVDALSVKEIAAEISRSLDFLESETRDLPDRHRSMRAIFDYSWALLSESDQRVFADLSVFRGGFTRTAAEEVAGATIRGLANLVGKSLLVSDRDTGRYSVHELLRQYAEEELRSHPASWSRADAAHTAFFADLAEKGEGEIVEARGQVRGLRALEEDLDNIKTALRQTLATGDAAETRRFVVGLAWLYEVRGWVKPGLDLMIEIADSVHGSEGDAAEILQGVSMAYQAKFLANLGKPDEAAPIAVEARESLQAKGDWVALAIALEALAEIGLYDGDLDKILALTGEGSRIASEGGSEIWPAAFMNYEAFVSPARGDVESALRVLTEGDRVLASHDEKIVRAWNLDIQAGIARIQERLDDALEIRTRQAKMAREVGYRRVLGSALTGLGSVHAAAGRLEAANHSYLDGLEIFEHTGQAPDMAVILIYLARSEGQSGNREHAVELIACVQGDPVRGQQFAAEGQTIEEVAQTELSSLASLMPDDTYAAAFQTGASKSLGISVRELLSDTDRFSEPR